MNNTRISAVLRSAALPMLALAALAGADTPQAASQPRFTDTFDTSHCTWSDTGDNPFFILEPGYTQVLEGHQDGADVSVTITVLNDTLMVDGVLTRVVEERESEDGMISEVSRNFFAVCEETGSVFYFGEDVDIYEGGVIVSHGGAWRSGVNGARFGLVMPGIALLGARWFQEVAPGVALDRAEIVSLTKTLETPAGTFQNCLRTRESSPLEKGAEFKLYAPGVGIIQDEKLLLVEYGFH